MRLGEAASRREPAIGSIGWVARVLLSGTPVRDRSLVFEAAACPPQPAQRRHRLGRGGVAVVCGLARSSFPREKTEKEPNRHATMRTNRKRKAIARMLR